MLGYVASCLGLTGSDHQPSIEAIAYPRRPELTNNRWESHGRKNPRSAAALASAAAASQAAAVAVKPSPSKLFLVEEGENEDQQRESSSSVTLLASSSTTVTSDRNKTIVSRSTTYKAASRVYITRRAAQKSEYFASLTNSAKKNHPKACSLSESHILRRRPNQISFVKRRPRRVTMSNKRSALPPCEFPSRARRRPTGTPLAPSNCYFCEANTYATLAAAGWTCAPTETVHGRVTQEQEPQRIPFVYQMSVPMATYSTNELAPAFYCQPYPPAFIPCPPALPIPQYQSGMRMAMQNSSIPNHSAGSHSQCPPCPSVSPRTRRHYAQPKASHGAADRGLCESAEMKTMDARETKAERRCKDNQYRMLSPRDSSPSPPNAEIEDEREMYFQKPVQRRDPDFVPKWRSHQERSEPPNMSVWSLRMLSDDSDAEMLPKNLKRLMSRENVVTNLNTGTQTPRSEEFFTYDQQLPNQSDQRKQKHPQPIEEEIAVNASTQTSLVVVVLDQPPENSATSSPIINYDVDFPSPPSLSAFVSPQSPAFPQPTLPYSAPAVQSPVLLSPVTPASGSPATAQPEPISRDSTPVPPTSVSPTTAHPTPTQSPIFNVVPAHPALVASSPPPEQEPDRGGQKSPHEPDSGRGGQKSASAKSEDRSLSPKERHFSPKAYISPKERSATPNEDGPQRKLEAGSDSKSPNFISRDSPLGGSGDLYLTPPPIVEFTDNLEFPRPHLENLSDELNALTRRVYLLEKNRLVGSGTFLPQSYEEACECELADETRDAYDTREIPTLTNCTDDFGIETEKEPDEIDETTEEEESEELDCFQDSNVSWTGASPSPCPSPRMHRNTCSFSNLRISESGWSSTSAYQTPPSVNALDFEEQKSRSSSREVLEKLTPSPSTMDIASYWQGCSEFCTANLMRSSPNIRSSPRYSTSSPVVGNPLDDVERGSLQIDVGGRSSSLITRGMSISPQLVKPTWKYYTAVSPISGDWKPLSSALTGDVGEMKSPQQAGEWGESISIREPRSPNTTNCVIGDGADVEGLLASPIAIAEDKDESCNGDTRSIKLLETEDKVNAEKDEDVEEKSVVNPPVGDDEVEILKREKIQLDEEPIDIARERCSTPFLSDSILFPPLKESPRSDEEENEDELSSVESTQRVISPKLKRSSHLMGQLQLFSAFQRIITLGDSKVDDGLGLVDNIAIEIDLWRLEAITHIAYVIVVLFIFVLLTTIFSIFIN